MALRNSFIFLSSLFLMSVISPLCSGATMDVSAFGAKGDGRTDDTAAIQNAINSIPSGSTLTFGTGNKIYLISSRLVFQPGRTYQGQGTLLMNSHTAVHTAIAKIAYNAANNITITGLTFDSNGVGGGIQIAVDGGGSIPATNIQITHNVFRNTLASPTGPWDGAIYSPVGLQNSQIVSNLFTKCGTGVYLLDPGSVVVSDNVFQTIHQGDAIDIIFAPAPFAYGQGLQILRNTGQHLGSMAIELWPSGGNVAQSSQVQGAVIANNAFSDWDAGYSGNPTGISVMAGQQMSVTNNVLLNGVAGMGIEIGAAQSLIQQNTIQNFQSGIVMQDSQGTTVSGNLLSLQTVAGIELTNAGGSRHGLAITGNHIINAQTFGIYSNTPSWGSSTVSGNSIVRLGGQFSADSNQQFTGIAVTPPDMPVTVTGNTITQSNVQPPPAGFSFVGIHVNGNSGDNYSSVYTANTISSLYQLAQTVGILGNSAGSLTGTTVQNNNFEGLNAVTGGAPSSGIASGGNVVYNCVQLGPIVFSN